MSFDHVAFQVSDMDSSISFYTQKLRFKLNFRSTNEEEQEEYAFLEYGILYTTCVSEVYYEKNKKTA